MEDAIERAQNYLNLVHVSNNLVLGLTEYIMSGEKKADLAELCDKVIRLAKAGESWSPRLSSQPGSASLIGDPGALRIFYLAAKAVGTRQGDPAAFWKRLRDDAVSVRDGKRAKAKIRACAERLRDAFDRIGELSMSAATEIRHHAEIAGPGTWLLNC